jgi:hypothetical protein
MGILEWTGSNRWQIFSTTSKWCYEYFLFSNVSNLASIAGTDDLNIVIRCWIDECNVIGGYDITTRALGWACYASADLISPRGIHNLWCEPKGWELWCARNPKHCYWVGANFDWVVWIRRIRCEIDRRSPRYSNGPVLYWQLCFYCDLIGYWRMLSITVIRYLYVSGDRIAR